MSPYNLIVRAHRLNLKYVGTGAICAIINNPSGSHVDFDQIKENVMVEDSDEVSRRRNAISVNTPDEPPAAEDTTHSSPKDSVTAAFVLHMNSIIESTPPGPLLETLSKFKERDWPNVERLLRGGEIKIIGELKSDWQRIESLVEDTNDIFLQEGALLLSLVSEEPDKASAFFAVFIEMEQYCMKGLEDSSLRDKTKVQLRRYVEELQECSDNIATILFGRTKEHDEVKALEIQRQKVLVLNRTFNNQTPRSRFLDLFMRHGSECLIKLQQRQLPLLDTPEIAAFSKTLQAVALSLGSLEFADKIFHVIRTTLRDADTSPSSKVASRLDAQCNEVFSQYKHLLSPVVLEFFKAQEEAVSKHIHAKSPPTAKSQISGLFSRLLPRRGL